MAFPTTSNELPVSLITNSLFWIDPTFCLIQVLRIAWRYFQAIFAPNAFSTVEKCPINTVVLQNDQNLSLLIYSTTGSHTCLMHYQRLVIVLTNTEKKMFFPIPKGKSF